MTVTAFTEHRGGSLTRRANKSHLRRAIRHQEGAVMYSPHLYSSLANARIDDLHRSMAASRVRRSSATNHSERGPSEPRLGARTASIWALVARFAH
jgi:hypothetical protein